jgi:dipeptidyl aminopeptidase/acylaminoacyl peptidase
MRIHKALAALLLCSALLPAATFAQHSSKSADAKKSSAAASASGDPLKSLFSVQEFSQVAISPDGKSVAWVEPQSDQTGRSTGKRYIYLAEVESPQKPVRITVCGAAKNCDEHDVTWSPDGKSIAFISDALNDGQGQLYIAAPGKSATKKLTTVTGLLAEPRWSPDGKKIAILFTENAARNAGPLVAETHETGEIKDAATEQRLAIVDVSKATLRQITPPDTYIYEYDWAPDSTRLVATAAKGNGDNNWYIAELFQVDSVSSTLYSMYKPKLQICEPKVSPNGKSVAFIEGLMSDEGSNGGDVFLVPFDGGAPRNLTPDRKSSAANLAWTSSGKLIDMEVADGESEVSTIDPASGQIDSLFHSQGLISSGAWSTSISLTPDGAAGAFARSSFTVAPEVWAGPVPKFEQITHHNAGLKPLVSDAKSLHWKNGDVDVQGWLLYPIDFDPAKKYPMVVGVHGGPSSAVVPEWPTALAYPMALPSAGYFLFLPNPRGSFGKGEAFTRANVKDFGYGDWKDILAGVDEAIRKAPIDAHRLGLTGWSYGGFMTMWGVTQTNRFRAAVAGAGLANWQSYYGQNQIDKWMIPFFGASVYDDPAVYARSAPIAFVKNVKTPTLILVGDSDGECPPPQSYEFWHALKTLGVETKMVVYDHEGHMFVNPDHLRDVIRRSTDWFNEYLN